MSKTSFSLVFLFLVSSFSFAQEENVEYNTPFGFEKIYLHTDRPHYFLMDTIWLKAYAWAALAEKGLNPSPSRTLYINLHDQLSGEPFFQSQLFLDEGQASGWIPLSEIPAGDYILTARTPLMKAWKEDLIFQKPIKVSEVGQVKWTGSAEAARNSSPSLNQQGINLGLLIEADRYRLIFDKDPSLQDTVYQLIGIQQGKPVFERILSLIEGRNALSLNLDDFLPGLVDFALLNTEGKILAERAVYFHPQAIPEVTIRIHKPSYHPRERVKVTLDLVDEFGEGLDSDFSVSVVDRKQVQVPEDFGNIVTEFELAQILGTPYSLSYQLFDNKDKQINQNINDLLAIRESLTGLSQYSSRTEQYILNDFGFTLMGKALDKQGKALPEGSELEFLVNPEFGSPLIATAKVGQDGAFELENLLFQGKASVISRLIGKQEKNNTEILDSDQVSFLPMRLPRPNITGRFAMVADDKALDDIKRFATIRNNRIEDMVLDLDTVTIQKEKFTYGLSNRESMYGGAADMALKVPEKGYETLNVFQFMRGRVPGMIMIGDVQDMANPPLIYFRSSVQNKMGGSIGEADSLMSTSDTQEGALFLLDGVMTSRQVIAALLITDVERIDILKSIANASIFGLRGSSGVINVLTKRPKQEEDFDKKSVVPIEGYLQTVSFPSCIEGNPQKDPFLVNYNATVFWEPYLSTGLEGKTDFEFVLNDLISEMLIVVEGITKEGQPFFGIHPFEVKE